jgi:hypothetical protein
MGFVLHHLCHFTHGHCHAAARDPRWRIGIESVDGETTGPILCGRCCLAGCKGARGIFLRAGRAEAIIHAAAAQQQHSIDTQSQPKCAPRTLAKQ